MLPGWLAIREKYKELQQKYGGGGAGYMPMNASTVPVAPRRWVARRRVGLEPAVPCWRAAAC